MKNCCYSYNDKKTIRSDENKRKLLNRLRRIEGQIKGLKNMVESDAYCTDILLQSSAASAALNAFSKELLSNHIKTCVKDDIKNGNEEVIDDLLNTLERMVK